MAEIEDDYGDSWADLPADIVLDIAGRLSSSVDTLAFRSLCSSWRLSTSPRRTLVSSFLPLKVPRVCPSPGSELSQGLADCVVSAGSVYLLHVPAATASSSDATGLFLLFATEFVEGKLWLRNPMSRSLGK